jgi:5-methylcytosine-specific restriction endonuclease McrA
MVLISVYEVILFVLFFSFFHEITRSHEITHPKYHLMQSSSKLTTDEILCNICHQRQYIYQTKRAKYELRVNFTKWRAEMGARQRLVSPEGLNKL